MSRLGEFREVRVLADGGDSSSAMLVIFGITGDLAHKMTYRNYADVAGVAKSRKPRSTSHRGPRSTTGAGPE
ncbi:MAG TPA: hypothetical protein VLZ05_02010 [Mycobacterium sp.]|nr:hypothetical protein [Mycobacterium sp.]HUH67739.1 hypothetical protein [Mycobacterium sp.]